MRGGGGAQKACLRSVSSSKVGWEMGRRAVALLGALLVFSLASAVAGKINYSVGYKNRPFLLLVRS